MCVRNSHMVSQLLLALLFLATGVFAEAEKVDCTNYKEGETDTRCSYHRIANADAKSIGFAKPSLCATDAPDHKSCKNYRVADASFEIYAPQAGAKGLHILLSADSSEVVNATPVKSAATGADSGYVRLMAYSFYPMDNIHLGVIDDINVDPGVSLVLNFYAPQVKYYVGGEEVTSASQFSPEVGDTIVVDAKLFIPIGPKTGQIDSINVPFYFLTPGETANLRFLSSAGKPLLEDKGHIRLDFVSGETTFMIVADKAKSDDSRFSLVGFPNKVDPEDPDFGEFLAGDPFPGDLQFVDRDIPYIGNAAIFDNNGDGIGDSIRVWMKGNMDSVVADTFSYSWPTTGKVRNYDGRIPDNRGKPEFILPDVKSTLQDPDNADGFVEAIVCSLLGGKRCASTKASLKDSIGAVIQSVTLIEGGPESETDTLEIRFNKIVDTTWTHGQGLLHQASVGELVAIDVEAVKKEKNVWRFTVEADKISVGDSIKINTNCKSEECPDGILTAADGVPTAANNQKVPVDNFGRIFANDNSAFFDRDGDGRMDSVSLGFDNPITRENLKNMTITFYWLNEKGELLAFEPAEDDIVLSADGSVLGYALSEKIQDSLGVKKMLTEINPKYMKSEDYGYAVILNKVKIDGKEDVEKSVLGMNDSIAPVISKTFLYPESFQYMEADKFTISFTEPIDVNAFDLREDCFAFLVDGAWKNYSFESAEWSDGNRKLTVRLETGVQLTERMNPADSVRFDNFTTGLCDKQGNNVSEKSPAVMVMGDPRVITETASFADLNKAEELSGRAKAFTSDTIKGSFDKKEMSSLGVLLDVGFATIMKKDSAGGDIPDLEKIGLVYELDVYTNLGGYVGGASEKILCNDEYFFDGNCLENPEKIYVRWNMRADNGRKVGVGVYLAKFKVKVFGAQSDFKIERIYRWGITASKR